MPFAKGESARQVSNARWEKTAAERAERRIEELVRMAPPLSESAKAKLRALLDQGGAA